MTLASRTKWIPLTFSKGSNWIDATLASRTKWIPLTFAKGSNWLAVTLAPGTKWIPVTPAPRDKVDRLDLCHGGVKLDRLTLVSGHKLDSRDSFLAAQG